MSGVAQPLQDGDVLRHETIYLKLVERTEDCVVDVAVGDLLSKLEGPIPPSGPRGSYSRGGYKDVTGGYCIGRRSNIGRRSKNGSRLPSALSSRVLSREHVKLTIDPNGELWIMDLASLHGTCISRRQRTISLEAYKPYRLEQGDELILGKPVASRDGVTHLPLRVQVHYALYAPGADNRRDLTPTFARSIRDITLPSRSHVYRWGIPVTYESELEDDLPGYKRDDDDVIYLGSRSPLNPVGYELEDDADSCMRSASSPQPSHAETNIPRSPAMAEDLDVHASQRRSSICDLVLSTPSTCSHHDDIRSEHSFGGSATSDRAHSDHAQYEGSEHSLSDAGASRSQSEDWDASDHEETHTILSSGKYEDASSDEDARSDEGAASERERANELSEYGDNGWSLSGNVPESPQGDHPLDQAAEDSEAMNFDNVPATRRLSLGIEQMLVAVNAEITRLHSDLGRDPPPPLGTPSVIPSSMPEVDDMTQRQAMRASDDMEANPHGAYGYCSAPVSQWGSHLSTPGRLSPYYTPVSHAASHQRPPADTLLNHQGSRQSYPSSGGASYMTYQYVQWDAPAYTPLSRAGSPVYTPLSCPGSPTYTPLSHPGSPTYTPLSHPGSPTFTPVSRPGSRRSSPHPPCGLGVSHLCSPVRATLGTGEEDDSWEDAQRPEEHHYTDEVEESSVNDEGQEQMAEADGLDVVHGNAEGSNIYQENEDEQPVEEEDHSMVIDDVEESSKPEENVDPQPAAEDDYSQVVDDVDEPTVPEETADEQVETAPPLVTTVVYMAPPSPPASPGTPDVERVHVKSVTATSSVPLTPPSPAFLAIKEGAVAPGASSGTSFANMSTASGSTRKRKISAIEEEEEKEEEEEGEEEGSPAPSSIAVDAAKHSKRRRHKSARLGAFAKGVALGVGLGVVSTFGALYHLGSA
ncbi:unnamed protein product [Cutaneotrichosporon oleaginosum]